MKKIMFDNKYGLEQAVLAGTKTMTRRVIKKLTGVHENGVKDADIVQLSEWGIGDDGRAMITATLPFEEFDIYPTYQPGEVVAVAERYHDIWMQSPKLINLIFFDKYVNEIGWKNKMYVRADIMPYRICITNVRFERLQDISDDDCLREGIFHKSIKVDILDRKLSNAGYTFKGTGLIYRTPRAAFAALIDKISGKGTWGKNPWVFVYEFELVKV